MAKFNEILVGRFARFVQKHFAMKGEVPMAQLSSDLQMVMEFNNGVENRNLEGWELFASGFSVAAVAASSGAVRIRNPAGSNLIAVMQFVTGHGDGLSNATLTFEHLVTNVDLAGIVSTAGAGIDPRGRPQPTCIVSQASPAAALTIMLEKQLVTSTSVDFIINRNQEIPILPGKALQIRMTDVNKALGVTFTWRERFLEDSERT